MADAHLDLLLPPGWIPGAYFRLTAGVRRRRDGSLRANSMQLQNITSQESSLVRSGLQCSFVLRQAVHGCGRTFGMEMIGGLKSSMTEPIKEL